LRCGRPVEDLDLVRLSGSKPSGQTFRGGCHHGLALSFGHVLCEEHRFECGKDGLAASATACRLFAVRCCRRRIHFARHWLDAVDLPRLPLALERLEIRGLWFIAQRF